MTNGGFQAARRATWVDTEILGFNTARLDRPRRRLSNNEKGVIVAECVRPDASLKEVTRRHRVSCENLRR